MSQLELNTTSLQELLDEVNALPDGEGGGSVEITLQEKSVTPTKSAQEVVADSGFDGLSKVNVGAIPDEYIVPSGTKTITENGTHDVTANASVDVNVPIPDGYIQPSGSITVTENGEYDVTEKASVVVSVPDKSEDLDAVIAEQAQLIADLSAELDGKAGGGTSTPTQEKTVDITANGTVEVTPDAGYALSKVTANVSIPSDKKPEQTKTVEITENGTVNVAPDSGKVLSGVTVNVNVPTSGGGESTGENKLAKVVSGDSVALTAEDLSGATRIIGYAFYDNVGITSIDIPSSVTRIDEYAFYRCSSLTSITIPNSVTRISGYAFYRCLSLTSIDIPNSVTIMDRNIFSFCSRLSSVNISNSVTIIAVGSFSYCSSLTSITIPSGVTAIGAAAFSNCSGMNVYDFSSHTVVPSISSDTFTGIPSTCQIKVPAALYDEWISATNWSAYADYIVAV